MSDPELIAELLRVGDLIPVTVFGTDSCCEHGDHTDCKSTGYGLCDRFTTLNVAGSDCNRANHFLLRPSDEAMDSPLLRQILDGILDEPDHDPPTKRNTGRRLVALAALAFLTWRDTGSFPELMASSIDGDALARALDEFAGVADLEGQ